MEKLTKKSPRKVNVHPKKLHPSERVINYATELLNQLEDNRTFNPHIINKAKDHAIILEWWKN